MQFNGVVATLVNEEQTAFSDAINIKRCKNLAVRIVSCWIIGKKVKWRWHSIIIVGETVLNIFTNNHVIANSKECFSRESNGHASVAYNYILRLVRIVYNYTINFPFCLSLLKLVEMLNCWLVALLGVCMWSLSSLDSDDITRSSSYTPNEYWRLSYLFHSIPQYQLSQRIFVFQ